MLLLIPGPVVTRPEVRAAMAQDYAPWDNDFRAVVRRVRERLLAIATSDTSTHAALPLQGCGHFATEAAIRSFVPRGGKILIPRTGQYADRMARLAAEVGRVVVDLPVPPDARTSPSDVAAALAADPAISHVGFVTSETSSGVVHDAVTIGDAVRAAGRRAIVDAVSAFGAVPFDLATQPEVDALVFTANKCLEAPPGMAFVIGRIDRLEDCAGQAEGWSFDLSDIYMHSLGGNGASRFTPPAQVIAAIDVALDLYDAEGGQAARLARYTANMRVLYDGAIALGLHPTLSAELQGPIVLNVDAPDHPAWNLQRFVDALKARGVLISNFYNTPHPSFRVGCIGAVSPEQMRGAVAAMDGALEEMGIRLRRAA